MVLIQKAIKATRLEHIETQILAAVKKADPRPFMALLLSGLRNLTTLYAQFPKRDDFLSQVLRLAV